MLNFNEGVDYLIEHGLAGLATAHKLFAWPCAQAQADVDPTATFVGGQCVQVGHDVSPALVVVTTGTLACTNRTIDIGALDFTAAVTDVCKSIVLTTKTPGTGALLLAIQNLNAGAAVDLSTQGPLVVDDLQILFGYLTPTNTVA